MRKENSMKKWDYKSTFPYLILLLLSGAFVWLLCLRHGVFGSKVDWISQHSVLPDYFRQQFYETGKLVPEFAANIGGGQNMYCFSYYGLLSPLVLPSYFLPFVKMSDYMMVVQFLCLTASVCLFYHWMKRQEFSKKVCMGAAVLFLLSGPMIFHSYNQLMFVNYMPFLCLAFLGTDRYFKERAKGRFQGSAWLTVSVFLMIMTSFYFSIGGMLVLVIYGMYRYFLSCEGAEKKKSLRSFFKEGIFFGGHLLFSVLMSGVLLVPTALALSERSSAGSSTEGWKLFVPQIRCLRFFYSPYGIGLTTFCVTALISLLFFRRWQQKVLAVSCICVLTLPIFAYLLNGGLYVRDKVMIPFLPLLCYIMAYELDNLERREGRKKIRNYLKYSIPYVITVLVCLYGRESMKSEKWWILLLAESVSMLLFFFVTVRKRQVLYLILPAVMTLAVWGIAYNESADRSVGWSFYREITDGENAKLSAEVLDQETGFYRAEQLGTEEENAANLNRIWTDDQYISSIYSSLEQEGYNDFRTEQFKVEQPFRNRLMQSASYHPVFQRFMGVRYILSEKKMPGYKLAASGKNQNIYENEDVLSVIRYSDRLLKETDYKALTFPYQQLALLSHTVVNDKSVNADGDQAESESVKEISEEFLKELNKNGVLKSDTGYCIQSKGRKKIQISLPESLSFAGKKEQTVLFLKFEVANLIPEKDVAIWMQGVRNKLTAQNHFYYNDNTEFTYAVPLENGQKKVEMIFGEGMYNISDIQCFMAELPEKEKQPEFQIDKEHTKGNIISGKIRVEEKGGQGNGYLVTSIPYEKNFEVLVDGKAVKTEKVNLTFLGFQVTSGEHEIQIVYHAPGVAEGKIVTLLGMFLFFAFHMLLYLRDKRSFERK